MFDKKRFEAIVQKTSAFFDKYELPDYKEFSLDIAERLLDKHKEKFAKADDDLLASAIVYALASVNEVLKYYDKKFSLDDISSFFNQTKKRITYYGNKIKQVLEIDKDRRYVSILFSNNSRIGLSGNVIKFSEAEVFYAIEAETEEDFYCRYPGLSVVLQVEMPEINSYREIQILADRPVYEVLDLISYSFFIIGGAQATEINTKEDIILLPDDDIELAPILDLFNKLGHTITIEYNNQFYATLKLKRILHYNAFPKFIKVQGPLLLDANLSIKENLELISNDGNLMRYFDYIGGIDYQDIMNIKNNLKKPSKKFMNELIDDFYHALFISFLRGDHLL